MKKILFIALMLLSIIVNAQDSSNSNSIDIGITKHSTKINNITYLLSLKNIVDHFGIWGNLIALDKNYNMVDSPLSSGAELNRTITPSYGWGCGINYCFNKLGLTINAGPGFIYEKTIITYYYSVVSSKQNAATPYKYAISKQTVSAKIFVDYDFLRKNKFVEFGLRLGYDTYSSAETGIFIGYKFAK